LKTLPLAEKLILEMSSKYNGANLQAKGYLQAIEKKTMIVDIKMLCSMLISSE
jgi:hypothetical protein